MISKIKKLVLVVMILAVIVTLTGCQGYNTPHFEEILPNETSFLVPMEGKTSDQAQFESVDFLKAHQVASKRIQIERKWVQTGRFNSGQYMDTQRLIKVDRTPQSRMWTNSADTGSAAKNQAFEAEDSSSIGFRVEVSSMSTVDEADAATFLYFYNGKKLSDIMDTDIWSFASKAYAAECAKLPLYQVITNKDETWKTVKDKTAEFFKPKGITIQTIGAIGQMDYIDKGIQAAINQKFINNQLNAAQKDANDRTISEATAKAEALAKMAPYKDYDVALKNAENMKSFIDALANNKVALPTTLVIGKEGNFLLPTPPVTK